MGAVTKRFWLFGSNADMASVCDQLVETFGIQIATHESAYRGGEYFLGRGPFLDEVIVQRNFEDEGYLAEQDFPEFSVLVYATQDGSEEPLGSLESKGLVALQLEEL